MNMAALTDRTKITVCYIVASKYIHYNYSYNGIQYTNI
jgi:hypothetical protein